MASEELLGVVNESFSLHDFCANVYAHHPLMAQLIPGLWKACSAADWLGPPDSADIDRPFPYGTLGAHYDPKFGGIGFE